MELLLPFLALAGLGLFLTGPSIAIAALRRVRRLEARLERLELRLAAAVPAGVSPEQAAQPSIDAPAPVTEPSSMPVAEEERPPPLPPPVTTATGQELESRFAQNWLVWLGGLALALGGVFAAAWAIEQGLLGPRVRLFGVTLLGLALIGLGERSRRGTIGSGTPDHIAAALVAGGLSALYGAALAAHLLYALLGPALAFALLALVSLLAVPLGLRFGPFVAALGAGGAYAAPFFIDAATPSPWALFLFLSLVAGSFGLLGRLAGWAWLIWLTLAGAVVHHAIGLAFFAPDAPGAPALHLAALGLTGLLTLHLPTASPATRTTALSMAGLVIGAAFLYLPWLLAAEHAASLIVSLALLSTATALITARSDRLPWLAAVLAAADLLAAAIWHFPPLLEPTSQLHDPSVALEPAFWLVPEVRPLAQALVVIASAYGGFGFVVATRGRRPGFWAGLSAAVPLLALATAYWRLEGLAVSPGYATLALALAAVLLLAAERVARRAEPTPALAAYAVGVAGALALGLTMTLAEAWLTVALALMLPAMAWIGRRLDLPALRMPAWVLTLVVLARLVGDVDFAPSSLAATLYAYGVPLLATATAVRWFRRGPRDALAEVLNGCALVFWILLAAQFVRGTLVGAGMPTDLGLVERSVHALVWLATGYALLRWHAVDPAAILPRFAWPLLAGTAALLAFVSLLEDNPLWTGEPVGPLPLVNALLLAYAGPALLGLAIARQSAKVGYTAVARAAGIAAHLLGFAWLNLELRHAFHGSRLTGPTSDAEWLAYSGLWLAWALLLLLVGITRRVRHLRAAALAIATLAVGKTFLFDLAELGGLYRALSFLALGLWLIGIGWLYRRLVARS